MILALLFLKIKNIKCSVHQQSSRADGQQSATRSSKYSRKHDERKSRKCKTEASTSSSKRDQTGSFTTTSAVPAHGSKHSAYQRSNQAGGKRKQDVRAALDGGDQELLDDDDDLTNDNGESDDETAARVGRRSGRSMNLDF